MAVTYFPFTPNINSPFQFTPVLDGSQYNAVVTWNLFAQRYYINLYASDGTPIFSLPVIGSTNWTNVQLSTTYQSQFATLSPTGSSGIFLNTQSSDLIVDQDGNY